MSESDPSPSGTLRLFTFSGIPVYLHWSWGLVAAFELYYRQGAFASQLLNLVEYLGLFLMVLLHEFGHAFAARSVGGSATHILLWPLGGVAYVRAPARPGALLWSIAAGPLVNFVLAPVLLGGWMVLLSQGDPFPDLAILLRNLGAINIALLVFNLLPIYPLDGGKIAQALLWFVVGPDLALTAVSAVGLVVSLAGAVAAFLWLDSWTLPAIALYAAWRSWQGLQVATARRVILGAPRRLDARCPSCREHPPTGPFWLCPNGHAFDAFAVHGSCPECGLQIARTPCVHCGEVNALVDYAATAHSQSAAIAVEPSASGSPTLR